MKTYLALIAALATPLLAANTSPAQVSQAQAQLDQAQAQLERAQAAAAKDQDAAREAILLAQESYSVNAPKSVSVSPWNWDATAPAGRTLVIPKEAAEPKDLPRLEEDLDIMARVLRKAAGGATEKSRSAMGIFIRDLPLGEGAAPQNLYLEGYGALFFLDVNYPLVAPPARKAEAETKEETSTEWDEARRELYDEAAPPNFNDLDITYFGSAPEQYDADKVERLKTDLLSALKNAAHIRHLKAEETVTVLVAGRAGKGESRLLHRPPGALGGGMGGGMMGGGMGGGMMGGGGVRSSGVRTVMRASAGGQASRLILRARKSDIDAFQKEKLSLEDFRKKVTVILH